MKKVDVVLRSSQEDAMKDLLDAHGVPGVTVTHVMGYGEQRGQKEMYRGTEVEAYLLPNVRFEVVLKDEEVEPLVELLVKNLSTGKVGDGKVFISEVSKMVRIRTGERLS
jgi:nitrogen regulatory protein P-II 1